MLITEEEFAALFPTTSNADMARICGVTCSAVANRARKRGLRKTAEYISSITLGRKYPPSYGAAITARMMGHPTNGAARAKMRQAKLGRSLSEEHKEAIRQSLTASNKVRRGNNHPNWTGGQPARKRIVDPPYRAWKTAVHQRDAYICQRCGKQCKKGDRGLAAHHVQPWKPFPERRYDPTNGQTMCHSCHLAVHGLTPRTTLEPAPCACGCGGLVCPDRQGRRPLYVRNHSPKARAVHAHASPETRAKMARTQRALAAARLEARPEDGVPRNAAP